MPATESEPVARAPAEVPLYTLWDAARYLRLPLAAVSRFSDRWFNPASLLWTFDREFFDPLAVADGLPPQWPRHDRVTFRDLAGLFVRAGALDGFVDWRRASVDSTGEFFQTVRWVLSETRPDLVSFDDAPVGERAVRLATEFDRWLDDTQRVLLRKSFARRLERVEAVDGQPVRFYPFSRDPAENSPRLVVLDPLVRFGRPCVAGRGVPTDALFERHQAGDSVAELAADYGLTAEEVEEALRFEAMPMYPTLPRL